MPTSRFGFPVLHQMLEGLLRVSISKGYKWGCLDVTHFCRTLNINVTSMSREFSLIYLITNGRFHLRSDIATKGLNIVAYGSAKNSSVFLMEIVPAIRVFEIWVWVFERREWVRGKEDFFGFSWKKYFKRTAISKKNWKYDASHGCFPSVQCCHAGHAGSLLLTSGWEVLLWKHQ